MTLGSILNKTMNYKYFNHLAVILLIASITGNFFLYMGKGEVESKVVKVDVDFLVRKLVKNVAEQTQEDVAKATKEKFAQVDALLEKLAEQEKFIILPAKAVVAGGIDITAQVADLLDNTETNSAQKAIREGE